MLSIEKLLSKSLKDGVVTGSRVKVFKSWSRKCSSQANSASKIREKVKDVYEYDIKYYPIKALDDRIKELESKIDQLMKEEKR